MKSKILSFNIFSILIVLLAAWYLTSSEIRPFLHYNFQQTGFLVSLSYFISFIDYPGGISDYLASFLAQFFSSNTFGSFLIAAVAALQGVILANIVSRLIGKIKLQFLLSALVIIFGVVVLCDYRYPYYASIRLLMAYFFTWVFCLIQNKNPKFSLAFWFVLAFLLFYLASGAALLVFALSTVLILLMANNRGWRFFYVPAFLISAGLMPFLAYKFIFLMSLPNLYRITQLKPPAMLAYTPEISLYIYYSLLPAILLVVFIFLKLPSRIASAKINPGEVASKKAFYKQVSFLLAVQLIGCLVLAYFLIQKFCNPLKRDILTIEYYAEHEQWTDVLKTSKKIKGYDFKVNFYVNRALSHLEQLPERLFEYPQILGSHGLFIDETIAGSVAMPTSDLYFDLGFMSESQHWAFEAQTLLPNSPRILKRLIMISLINRQYEVARDFLKLLDQNMLCRDWDGKYHKYVNDTTLAVADPLIAEKRRFMPKNTQISSGAFDDLQVLVETNKDNRMAYDYLLSYCLLDSHFPQFVKYLEYYPRYGIKTLPRSWEEALALYIMKSREVPAFVSPQLISEKRIQQFLDFNKQAKQFNKTSNSGEKELYGDYGDTFWYYILYLSPKVTNALQNKIEVQ